jgi:hypothetical protein
MVSTRLGWAIARIGKSRETSVYAEVVERCEYRVTVPFGGLFLVFGQGKQKAQHLFRGYAGKIAFAKLSCKSGEDKLTSFDGIFFSSLTGDTADGSLLPGIRS